jgi:hypothetical protein
MIWFHLLFSSVFTIGLTDKIEPVIPGAEGTEDEPGSSRDVDAGHADAISILHNHCAARSFVKSAKTINSERSCDYRSGRTEINLLILSGTGLIV